MHSRLAQPLDSKIMILEEDASFAPAAFSPNTEAMLRALKSGPEWNMLKLGECETFTDDERGFAAAKDTCATSPSDPINRVNYQRITGMAYDPAIEYAMGGPDQADPRVKRSYCSHSYIIGGHLATHLVGTHYPIFSNCDDQMRDACETSNGKESACKRLDKYVFNQNQSSGSSLASSCHPCNGEETFDAAHMGKVHLEEFKEPRPQMFPLLTGADFTDALPNRTCSSSHCEWSIGQVKRHHPTSDDPKAKAPTWQQQDVNNMCGLYSKFNGGSKDFNAVQCGEMATVHDCYNACRHNSACRSYIYHPKLSAAYNKSSYPTSQYFMCQQDPYTDLSEHMDISKWEGKCCHRMDDKWQPFIPPVWYYYDRKQPHVTSGSVMGGLPLSTKDEAENSARFEPGSVRGGLRVHMSDQVPDYLGAARHDEVDADPHSPAALRHASAVEYLQYGNIWAVARKQCQRRGMDLCPPTSYCKNGNQTRMVKALMNSNWWVTPNTATQVNNAYVWMPTLRSCNSWVNLKTCSEPDGHNPDQAPYRDLLQFPAMNLGCCEASEEATESTTPSEIAADHARRAFLARPNNRNWILNTLDDASVRRQIARRGKPAVLRIVVNHATSGLFASFQWVMLAMRFARASGLRTYVDHGPCTLCGYAPFTQDYSYHDWTAGPNAWTYFWEPTDTLSDLMEKAKSDPDHSVDVVTLDTHQIWRIFGMHPRFDIQSFQKGDFSGKGLWGPTLGKGGYVRFDPQWWAKQRGRAWQLVGKPRSTKPIRLAKGFAAYEDAKWRALLASSAHHGSELEASGGKPKVLAVHIRGTDKQCSIGGPKIAADKHFALIDAFLTAHKGSLVFCATDQPSIAKTMRARYGSRLLLEDAVRSEKNALHEHGFHGEGYAFGKAAGAMLDSVHLSRGDFLLCANSALGESAVWLNPKLAENMFNMQFPLQEQLKSHHQAMFGDGLNLESYSKVYAPGLCEIKPA